MTQQRRKRLTTAAPSGEAYTAEPFKASGASAFGAKGKSLASLFASAGFSVTPTRSGTAELESAFEQSWVVNLCCRLWARAVSQVRPVLYTSKSADAEEAPESDPLYRALLRPNPNMSWAQLAEADVVHRKLSGESFWFLFAPAKNEKSGEFQWQLVNGLIPLPFQVLSVIGDKVQSEIDGRGQVTHWSFGAQGGAQYRASREAVIHFRDYDPADPTRGLGAAEVAYRQLSIAFQTERQQESQQRAGGPGAFLIYDADIERNAMEAFQQEIDASTRDPENNGQYKAIGGGPRLVPSPATPDKMQHIEVLRYSRDVVCSVMEVPVHLISPDASTYSNLQEAWKQFWIAVVGYLKTVAEQINAQLLPRMAEARYHGYRFEFEFAGIEALREDQSARLKAAAEIANMTGLPLARVVEALSLDIDPALFESVDFEDDLDDGEDVEDGDDAATPQPTATATATAPAASAVQDQALNGSQVSSLLDILRAVSEGLLTQEGAVAAIRAAFPFIDEAAARAIVQGVNETPKDEPETAPEPEQPDDSPDAKAAFIARTRRIQCGAKTPLGPLTTREQRSAYYKRFLREVSAKHERRAKVRVTNWLKAYEREVLARVRKFAATGELPTKAQLMVAKDKAPKDPIKDALLPSEVKFKEMLEKALRAPLLDGMKAALKDQAAELGGVAIQMTDPRVTMVFDKQLTKVVEGAHSTVAQRVRNAIAQSIEGEVTTFVELRDRIEAILPELEGSLQSVFADKTGRAGVIARTEMGKATNTARDLQMREEGVVRTQWISERDDDVRSSHEDLDGQIQPIGQDFKPGLAFPGDDRAPAGEVINCRCLALAIVEEPTNA